MSYEKMVEFAKYAQNVNLQGQTDIFGSMDEKDAVLPDFEFVDVTPLSFMERLNKEKDFLGLFVSGHPLKGLKRYLSKKVLLIDNITDKHIGKKVALGGLLTSAKKVFTKAGKYMMYGELEDPTGRIRIVIFPRTYEMFQHLLQPGKVMIFEGRLDVRGNEFNYSVQSVKSVSLEVMIKNAKNLGVYDENEKISRKVKHISVEAKSVGVPDEVVKKKEDDVTKSEWNENPYVIKLPDGISNEKLVRLKNLLLAHQGERIVELDLNGKKRVRLSFGISVDDELEREISEII